MTDLDQPLLRLIVFAALLVNLALIALAWRAAFRTRQVWSKRWGWVCLAIIVTPVTAAAFFPSIATDDAFNFGIGMLNALAGVWMAGIALCPWISFDKNINPQARWRGQTKAVLFRIACLGMAPFLFWLGHHMLGDFLQPPDIVEGRVERRHVRQGKYGTYGHIQISGRDHQANANSYAIARQGDFVKAEVGATSGRIYRLQLR